MTKPDVRCAIYTRKSTEEGLDQAFNSLDAQREACEAYIQSQAGESWKLVPARYDDGGFSGGNMERPGLAKLLDDVAAGRVDVVVVYKIDRLTRSLRDFAKIVDQLEKRNASFVSVTQAFNTTTSMGRLTLNVLLSFAQFEREVTAERIRDKIAASRKRGIFMGGCPPLGYDAKDRKLVINQTEADTVRHIYKRYLEVGGVADLRADLEAQGILPKQWVSARGHSRGGKQWYIGPLRHILRNRVYIGEATHKGVSYPGEHDAILERDLFDAVQAKLDDSRVTDERRKTVGSGALLKGLLFDAGGYPMSPQRSRSRTGKQHLYYVSQARLQKMSKTAPRPLPSTAIEEVIRDRLTTLAGLVHQQHDDAGHCAALEGEHLRQAVQDYVARVDVQPAKVIISCNSTALARDLKRKPGQIAALIQPALPVDDEVTLADALVQVCVPVRLPLRGGTKRIEGWKQSGWTVPQTRPDPVLIRALAQAHDWRETIQSRQVRSLDELAKQVGQDRKHLQRLLRLAFLAPDIQKMILTGTQSAGMNLSALIDLDLPMTWAEQRTLLQRSSPVRRLN